MSDESSALATAAFPSSPTDAEYDAIQAALMETARGRAFLAEHARRSRSADIASLLAASERIEAAMREQRIVETSAPAQPSDGAISTGHQPRIDPTTHSAPQAPSRDDAPASVVAQPSQPTEYRIDQRVPSISWFEAKPAPETPAPSAPAPAAEPPKQAPSSSPSANNRTAAVTADDFADLLFEPGAAHAKPDTLPRPPDASLPDRAETQPAVAKPTNGAATAAHPARHGAMPASRESDPLAALKAMSDEEKIALFS